jgi:biopolymer transport protein ExbD
MFLLPLWIPLLQAPMSRVDVCPEVIQIAPNGEVFTNRFHGRYRTSMKRLESDLRAGCYNDANPSPVTSVTIEAAPNAPSDQMNRVYEVLEQNGWRRGKITVKTWTGR